MVHQHYGTQTVNRGAVQPGMLVKHKDSTWRQVMKKECGYCHKPVEEGAEVKSTLLYLNGSQLAQKEKEYCSKQCAEYDQMAHES